ncbi:MAG: HD domain-containing protein [Actinobacteria bacterium]|nr:HD domain-containing protein [Actinomycetota bacterium]
MSRASGGSTGAEWPLGTSDSVAEEIHLSKRFFRATEWAAECHVARAADVGHATPSLGQVLGIASLLLEDGGSEREAIAAMLLDAIGDGDVPLGEIREEFGKKVTNSSQPRPTRALTRGAVLAGSMPSGGAPVATTR